MSRRSRRASKPAGSRTPDGIELAGFGRRFLGRFIDWVLTVIPAVIWVMDALILEEGPSGDVPSAALLYVSFGVWFLNDVVLTAITGGTIGKLIIGTRVVRMDGSRVSLWRALARWVVGTLLTWVPFFVGTIINAILMFTNKRRQTLPDKWRGRSWCEHEPLIAPLDVP